MQVKHRSPLRACGLAALSLAMLGAAVPQAAALAQQDADDDKKVTEQTKPRTTVKIIRSGNKTSTSRRVGTMAVDPAHAPRVDVYVHSDGKVEHTPHGIEQKGYGYNYSFGDSARTEALEKMRSSLADVMAELDRAEPGAVRSTLEVARSALEQSIEALEMVQPYGHHMALGGGYGSAVRGLDELRGVLGGTLGDVEVDIDLEGNLQRFRLGSMPHGKWSLYSDSDEVRNEHIDALRAAEEDLRRARENLERKMEEERAKKDKDSKENG